MQRANQEADENQEAEGLDWVDWKAWEVVKQRWICQSANKVG